MNLIGNLHAPTNSYIYIYIYIGLRDLSSGNRESTYWAVLAKEDLHRAKCPS
jgi:hypothetical protein